ncbi:MAG: zinc ribbon domain-containing protein [Dechloromonas sp.]|nr:zinc ribbon domain-containing protein [Dechloromonas sp.]
MQCGKCGKEVPEGALYCPFCVGELKTTERDVIVGGVKGGLLGLTVGLVPALVLLYLFGAERGIKAIVFALPVATFTTGLILGMVRAKQDWK